MGEQGPALSFSIAFGVELDTYRVMDTGMARSAYAALEYAGCIHPKIAAAAIKATLHYLDGGAPDGRGEKISPEKVFQQYGKWKDELKLAIETCMCFGNRSGGPLLLNQSTAVALHLLFQLDSAGYDDEVNDFFHRLHTGFGIADGRDPIGKARKELAKLETRETKAKRAAIVVNAWNAIYGGPKNGIASWRATDPREKFPRVI